MCMCCGDHSSCIFAAIFSIVQSSLNIGWCVWGINLYNCFYRVREGSFAHFFYLTYFYTQSCMTPSLDNMIGENITDSNSELVFPPESAVVSRTIDIFTAYMVIDVLWILTAFGLLVGAIGRIRGPVSIIFFFPWSMVLLIILFFDATASILYGVDLSYTYGLREWFIFIGGKNHTALDDKKYIFPSFSTTLPSLLMMVVSAKFFVIWFINLALFFRIVQSGVNAAEDFDDECTNASAGRSGNKKRVTTNKDNFQMEARIASRLRRESRQAEVCSDTEDEDKEESKRRSRRHSRRSSRQTGDDGSRPSSSKPGLLTISGGYEGDRSTSPSPLPALKFESRSVQSTDGNVEDRFAF